VIIVAWSFPSCLAPAELLTVSLKAFEADIYISLVPPVAPEREWYGLDDCICLTIGRDGVVCRLAVSFSLHGPLQSKYKMPKGNTESRIGIYSESE